MNNTRVTNIYRKGVISTKLFTFPALRCFSARHDREAQLRVMPKVISTAHGNKIGSIGMVIVFSIIIDQSYRNQSRPIVRYNVKNHVGRQKSLTCSVASPKA